MTIYAGETVTFITSATQPDEANTPITDTDVTAATITIYDSATGAIVQAEDSLTWDATDQRWTYAFTTSVAGKFEARLRLMGLTFDTWEYQKLAVKEDRF